MSERGALWLGIVVKAALVRVLAFGAATAILWELAEYVAFIRNSSELETAYTDTLGDLMLGLSGSVVAGALSAIAVRPSAVSPELPARLAIRGERT